MDIQVERLKGKSIQFSIPLIQTKLSEDLIHELIEVNDEFREFEILFITIGTKDKLKELKEFLSFNKLKIPKDIFDNCMDELKEIGEDLKWSNSKEGKKILELEDWVIKARNKMNETEDFKTIFIGRSYVEPTSLIISGITKTESQEDKLKEEIRQLNPPAIPKYVIERPLGFLDFFDN